MIAVELTGGHIYDGVCFLYMGHVVLQYAIDVENLIIKNLRLRFWRKNKIVTYLY